MKSAAWLKVALLALLLGGCSSGPQAGREATPPMPEQASVYSDEAYFDLVRKYTADGGGKVDYAAWKADPADLESLDRHIEIIAQVSPDSDPGQFPSPSSRRSYWINSYNALVLHAVLEYWPLESVRDVKISLSSRVVPGKGFFYDRKVTVGGKETSLYRLEKEVLASQKDPRLHFALNCASESCPVLRPSEWSDDDLNQAARDFVNNPGNVSVEDGKLAVSRIFKWYKKDFPADLNSYLQQFAEPALLGDLQNALEQGFPIIYRDYDWSLNAEESTS